MKDEISESNKIHFAVMALEASSRKMNISPMEMYRRLKRVGLFKRLVLDCYDVMHTQSLKHVSEDLVEALSNWEKQNKHRRTSIGPADLCKTQSTDVPA